MNEKKVLNINLDFKPEVKELKTKHAHFLLTPKNFEKLEALAKESGLSKNELINCIIEKM